jgi:Ran GTPase-activating protein (RanGAP) involved in mRNA processing and transport
MQHAHDFNVLLLLLVNMLHTGGAHLSQLDLGFNTLADRAAAALAALLPSTPLFALELEGNAISNAGAATLASALRGSTSLQRLNLNGNRLSGGSALARLSEALRGTPGMALCMYAVL